MRPSAASLPYAHPRVIPNFQEARATLWGSILNLYSVSARRQANDGVRGWRQFLLPLLKLLQNRPQVRSGVNRLEGQYLPYIARSIGYVEGRGADVMEISQVAARTTHRHVFRIRLDCSYPVACGRRPTTLTRTGTQRSVIRSISSMI